MTPLRQQMMTALQRSGKGERTPQASVRAVRLLAQCYRTSPASLFAQALQHYCLHRTKVAGLAPASMHLCDSGSRVFSQHVLHRAWHPLSLLRAESAHRLPAVRSVEEVRRLLTAATPLHHRASCTILSSGGLRLHEGLSLHVSDLDRQRLLVHVPRGQGATDRDVPLPADPLALLRASWNTHRHPTWLFPATGRDHTHMPVATDPMRRTSVQGACRTATQRAGITQRAMGLHTLRHAYAAHRLAAGVTLRVIQRSLGHTQRDITMVSLPLTQTGQEDASARIHAVMRGLRP